MRRLAALALAAAVAWCPAQAAAHEDEKDRTPALVDAEGEPLTFTDHRGRAVTEESFLGQFLLIYFGYTHCPDVCPTDLQVITHAVEELGEAGAQVTPIFITVDPERDTVAVMADYIGHFHPRMVGLTGTPDEIARARMAFRVRAMKFFLPPSDDDDDDEDADEKDDEEDDEDEDYVFSHTSLFYLIDADGKLLTTFHRAQRAERIAAKMREYLHR
jgi:protein SCO1/2